MTDGVQTKTLSPGGFERLPGKIITRTIAAATVDAGNTGRTHELRRGLVLGVITASGKFTEYDDDGTDDGRRVAVAILAADVDMKDGDPTASAVDHKAAIYVDGWVDSSKLHGYDAAAGVDLNGAGKIYVD